MPSDQRCMMTEGFKPLYPAMCVSLRHLQRCRHGAKCKSSNCFCPTLYNLLTEDYKQEENIIHNIMHNNSFPIHPQKPSIRKPEKRLETTQTALKKWATSAYTGKETTFITNTRHVFKVRSGEPLKITHKR